VKAVLCRSFGPPEMLELADIPSPQPKAGEVTVRVEACGVNFPDLLAIENKYQFKPDLPFTPGGEVAGVIDALGPGVEGLKIGDRVMASTMWGGFAEEVVADAGRVIRLKDGVDFAVGASLSFAYGTTLHALKDRAALKAGETLLVLGAAGGVGLAAVELGHAIGARVIAAASTDDKLKIAREHGAHETLLYPRDPLSRDDQKALSEAIKELTRGAGADVVYDPVGGDYSEPALRATAWEGRFLVIGFAAGPIPRIPLNLALLKGCEIVGVFWGAWAERNPDRNRENIDTLMDWTLSDRIRPYVSASYSLARAADALKAMAARQVTGKIVVTPN